MVYGHKRSVRAQQPVAHSGLGIHFKSPLKRRDQRKKQPVRGVGREHLLADARQRLDALLRREPLPSAADASLPIPTDGTADTDADMADWVDSEPLLDPPSAPSPPRIREPTGSVTAAQRLDDTWNHLLPDLQAPWLRYYERTHGQQRGIIPTVLRHECTKSCEASVDSKIRCLYPTRV